MRTSPRARIVFTCVGVLLALQWSLTAQVPVTAKKPLGYDVVDYWKSIQGTRLSDGQWLAYATSAHTQLAFMSDQADYAQKVSPYRLYYWKATEAAATEVASAATAGMPKGMVVSEFAAPRFSKDGGRLYLGTGAPPAATLDPADKTPEPVKIDLWSYKDPLIQPMQKVRDQQERERSYRAVVHLADKRFVQVATPDLPNVNAGEDPAQLIATSDMPYRQEISWDQDYNDVYLLDLETGPLAAGHRMDQGHAPPEQRGLHVHLQR